MAGDKAGKDSRKAQDKGGQLAAISGYEELDSLINTTIAGGDVIPHIHKSLIGKKGQQKTV